MPWSRLRIHAAEACLLILAGVGGACSDATAPRPAGLSGSFEGPLSSLTGFGDSRGYLGLSILESSGLISGTAFSSYVSSHAATVSGTYADPDVFLEIRSVYVPETWQFRGTFAAGRLTGEFAFVPGRGFQAELKRADTTASGQHSVELEGAITRAEEGPAFFTWVLSLPQAVLALESPSAGPRTSIHIFWPGLDNPRAGSYSLGEGGAALATMNQLVGSGVERAFGIRSGTVSLEIATRYTLIGRYDLRAIDPVSGGEVRVNGRFSAGCVGPYC